MKFIVCVFATIFSYCMAILPTNDIDGRFGRPYDHEAHQKVNEIRRLCSQKWNLTYYNIYSYSSPNNVEANSSVKCAMECEMKARKFITDNGELDTAIFSEEYDREHYIGHSGDDLSKTVAEYVKTQCFKQWNQDDSTDTCEKAFTFNKCVVKEQQNFYKKRQVKECLYKLQMKNNTQDKLNNGRFGPRFYAHPHPPPPPSHLHHPHFPSDTCMFTSPKPWCYMTIHSYILSTDVDRFNAVAEETGFLEDNPETKDRFMDALKKCYTQFDRETNEDCNRDIIMYTGLVHAFKEFQILELLLP